MQFGPSAVSELFDRFRTCFTAPGYRHFVRLVVGWLLVRGTHTISRVLQAAQGLGLTGHHASVYRFLSHGRWSLDKLGHVVFRLLRPWLSETVVAIVDDTLCPKSGRQLFGVGIHHDSARSAYSRKGRRIEAFCSGHNWVVLAVHLPCPWQPERGWAIPVLFRLYRSKSRCPAVSYRKRTALGLELITQLASWLDPDQRLYVTGDAAYCCKTVLHGLPEGVHFVGPLPLDAALYETVGPSSKYGRRRLKGYRVANPRTRLAQRRGWTKVEAALYGRSVRVQLFTDVCVWYPSAGNAPVRIVITRDPKGHRDGRAYLSTDPDLSPQSVLALYAQRWQLEVTFREIKQELGFEDPRNGWWRRPRGRRDDPTRPPCRHPTRKGQKAVERTAPLAAVVYALTIVWYLRHGSPALDVARAREQAPWYKHKCTVSFTDMLAALRRDICWHQFCRMRLPPRIRQITAKLWEVVRMPA